MSRAVSDTDKGIADSLRTMAQTYHRSTGRRPNVLNVPAHLAEAARRVIDTLGEEYDLEGITVEPVGKLYADEQVAHVVHEANRALQIIQGDPAVSVPWEAAPHWQQASATAGVVQARNGASPRELHEAWCQDKRDSGWSWGPVKDADLRTHPCLVPYEDLPEPQRHKDVLFLAIVGALP
jgi:hypothetical protein